MKQALKKYFLAIASIAILFVSACTVQQPLAGEPGQQGNLQQEGQGAGTGEPDTSQQPDTNEDSEETGSTVEQRGDSGISMQELSAHNSQSDCWISYKGKVYDITSYLPKHPGTAAAISPYCGTAGEFEDAFAKQHGTKMAEKLAQQGTYKGDLGA